MKAIEIAQNMEAAEKNLQQIKDPWSASSYEIITECATSNKQSTTSNLEVVTDVVTQIMQQRTANLEKLSATSAEKLGILQIIATQRQDKRKTEILLLSWSEESICQEWSN